MYSGVRMRRKGINPEEKRSRERIWILGEEKDLQGQP
jgi:hypothetical protein